MLGLSAATSIFLYRGACDLRKSFDGLCGLVRSELNADPLSGSLFVFLNRRRNMIKVLYWAADGFAIWFKRLEKGCFVPPGRLSSGSCIDRRQFTMLLEGVIPQKVRKRYFLRK